MKMCEWSVPDEPECRERRDFEVLGLELCVGHAARALAIRETVLAEKEGHEAGRKVPRRFYAANT